MAAATSNRRRRGRRPCRRPPIANGVASHHNRFCLRQYKRLAKRDDDGIDNRPLFIRSNLIAWRILTHLRGWGTGSRCERRKRRPDNDGPRITRLRVRQQGSESLDPARQFHSRPSLRANEPRCSPQRSYVTADGDLRQSTRWARPILENSKNPFLDTFGRRSHDQCLPTWSGSTWPNLSR